jgi:ArsR family transcriptional regulator
LVDSRREGTFVYYRLASKRVGEVEFEAGHIKGARSVPVEELVERIDGLPRSREIVAYCRGPYCVYATDAVRLLRERGFKVRRLREGFPEWERAGLPVDRSDTS